MQGTNILMVEYKNQSIRFNNPQISEIDGALYIWHECPNDMERIYNAFDYPELISDLITLVKKRENGRDKVKLTKMWVKKWGVLNREKISDHVIGQKFDLFWRQAKAFQLIWTLYKYVANRDKKVLEHMNKIFEQFPEDYPSFADDALNNHQLKCMMFITEAIERYTKNGFIRTSEVKRLEKQGSDSFNITPEYYFHQLLDALYMQFFISLTENKKVCPICDSPFTPSRHDQIYDRESCKRTAKSRRYRESKKHSIL